MQTLKGLRADWIDNATHRHKYRIFQNVSVIRLEYAT